MARIVEQLKIPRIVRKRINHLVRFLEVASIHNETTWFSTHTRHTRTLQPSRHSLPSHIFSQSNKIKQRQLLPVIKSEKVRFVADFGHIHLSRALQQKYLTDPFWIWSIPTIFADFVKICVAMSPRFHNLSTFDCQRRPNIFCWPKQFDNPFFTTPLFHIEIPKVCPEWWWEIFRL